jgi:hypothetical protein
MVRIPNPTEYKLGSCGRVRVKAGLPSDYRQHRLTRRRQDAIVLGTVKVRPGR